MRLFVPAEIRPGERRCALVPETVGKLAARGFDVTVEPGAGRHALATDAEYEQAGATLAPDGLSQADVVASVRPLSPEQAARLKEGAATLSFLQPAADAESIEAIAARGGTALSFDLLPRISRAQSMDALTSQALVAGYRAALIGADRLPKFFPLFMTAAGTIPPARVLVLGAGVAGLQAIATAKRLGALVSAYDVRAASGDEVRSMGATFVDLDLEAVEGSGGYAREMAEDRAARQQELLAPHVADADVLITTAAIPGRAAPRLVTAQMVSGMKAGSVVVDLAAESGGNVEGTRPGEEFADDGGVLLWGAKDVASQLPVHASKLLAMNAVAVLTLITADNALNIDPDDEIIDGCAVVLDGQIRKGV